MANTENIEAKLCAYVDGELNAADRAEIEAHLAANPQHRELIEELRKERGLLGELPRERAPEDLFEAFQNQLERSVLLDSERSDAQRAVAGRIERGPQLFAVAAILMLAVGLAMVIYFVLPQQRSRRASPYAISAGNKTPSHVGEPSSLPAADFKLGTADSATRAEDRSSTEALAFKTGAGKPLSDLPAPVPSAAVPSAAASPPPSANPMPATISPEPSFSDVFAKEGESATAPVEPKMAAKGGAGGEITNIFDNENIEKKLKESRSVPADSVVMVVSSQDPSAANRSVQDYLGKNGIRWDPVPEPMPTPVRETQALYPSKMQRVESRMKGGDQIAQSAESNSANVSSKALVAEEAPPAAAAAPPADVTQPAQSSAGGQLKDETVDRYAAKQQQQVMQQPMRQTAEQAQQIANPVGSSQIIVARGLTPRQVSELNSNLAMQNSGRVYNYRRGGVVNGAGLETSMNQAANVAAAPTTQPGIAVDGGSLAKSDRLRDLDKNITAAAGPATTTATTQPTGQLQQAAPPGAGAATQRAGIAATQPGAAGRLDVIICIQPGAVQGQTVLPTTTPATPAATRATTSPTPR